VTNIVLIGGGGFALEIFDYLQSDIKSGVKDNVRIKGVLDGLGDCELVRETNIPYLGKIEEYEFGNDERVIITFGDQLRRRKFYHLLKEKNVNFYTYIHPTSVVSKRASLAEGVVIPPYCVVNANARIQCNVALNVYCGVGHGAKVGKHSVFSPYSGINGNCELGEATFLGSRVMLFPNVHIGDYTIIDAGVILRNSVGSRLIVSQRTEQKEHNNRIIERQL
jgi:sugar O-acyltransferase (sialic acid O-acetyltransferase NeuD family)